jgi:hypothetical protein
MVGWELKKVSRECNSNPDMESVAQKGFLCNQLARLGWLRFLNLTPLWIGLTADRLNTSTDGLIFSPQTWISGACLVLEAFRGNSTLILGSLCRRQILTWIALGSALFGLKRRNERDKITNVNDEHFNPLVKPILDKIVVLADHGF